jgi:FkbM family methyltransferase
MTIRHFVRRFLSRQPRPHRILSGPLAGKKIVTSWHDYPAAILGYAERSLLEWLLENVQPEETWVDVGAHYGYTSLAMCERVGRNGKVFSFEPCLATVGCLERTRKINKLKGWTVFPIALTDARNFETLNLLLNRGMVDPLIDPEDSEGFQEVLAVSFDVFWSQTAQTDSDLHGIKIDVQGMEVGTLRGMQQTLLRHHPKLVIEIHEHVPRDEVVEILSQCGYEVKPIPIERNVQTNFYDPFSNYSFLFLPAASK